MHSEMEAVAQRPSEPLHAFNDVGAGEGVLAVPLDPFDDEVLDQGDEAAQAHGVEMVAGETETEAEVDLGVGDGETVGQWCGQS